MGIARRLQQAAHAVDNIAPVAKGVYSDAILADNPTVYYAMQETSGTTMVDSSGNQQHGTYFGSPTLDSSWDPYEFAPVALGRHVSTYNVTSNDQYMQLPADCVDPSGGFTFEIWARGANWGYNTRLFYFGDDLQLYHGQNNTTFGLVINGVETDFTDYGGDDWHYLVVTVPGEGGTAKVYYDAVEYTSTPSSAITKQSRPEIYIGRAAGGANGYYTGFLTQAVVYETVLSQEQINTHYAAGLADADPVWHGVPDWADNDYFSQFTNGALLANPDYVPVADWMPPAGDASSITAIKPYCDIGINAVANDFSWFRDADMYLLEGGGETGIKGSETIGYCVDDEPDMRGTDGLTAVQGYIANVPAGEMVFCGFGATVSGAMGSNSVTPQEFTNLARLNLQACDYYWYSSDIADAAPGERDTYNLLPDQRRRACNYGAMLERIHSTFDQPRAQWNDIEVAHPSNGGFSFGGPNPDQVEGAVWGSIIGGARGIILFHHNFVASGSPPDWSATTDYTVNTNVAYNGVWYYAALKPAIGEVPTIDSYTWVRFDGNSGAGLGNNNGRHPDLPARLEKIKADLQTMAPAINSPTTPHLCHKDIYSVYRPNAHDGKKYIIALPGLNAPDGGTFNMYVPKGENPTSIEVVGESRTITPSGGKFTDTFAAEYSHHIYRWS